MIKFDDSDFDDLRYPVHKLDKPFLDAFPEFKKYPEFQATIQNKEKVLKYVVLYYDKHSPFRSIEKIEDRKVQAAFKAGFEVKREQFDKSVEDILVCGNQEVNCIAIRYLRHCYGIEFSSLMMGLDQYYRTVAVTLEDASQYTNDKGEQKKTGAEYAAIQMRLYKDLKLMQQDLTKDADLLFNGDRPLLNLSDLIVQSENPTPIGGGIAEMFARRRVVHGQDN